METCVNYCDADTAYFSSDERRWINRIRRLKKEHPEQVRIIREPEQNDGCIYAEVPVKWLKVSPPPKRVLTEEQRMKLSKRMKMMHQISSEPQ